MYTCLNTVTLFLRSIHIGRRQLALLWLCLVLLCVALVLMQQATLHHWLSPFWGHHGFFTDGSGTPWDGGDAAGA